MMSTPGSLSEFSSTGNDLAISRLPTTLCSGERGLVRRYTEQLKLKFLLRIFSWEAEATLKHAPVLQMVAKSDVSTVKPALLVGPRQVM